MAQQVVVEMVDDLDGTVGEDVTTVSFALDGRTYEIDLCERNAEKLRHGLADYIDASRRPRGGRSARRAKPASASTDGAARQRAQAIREWAQGAGHQLSERGRIPANVVEAYEQAQGGSSSTPSPDKASNTKPTKRAAAKASMKTAEKVAAKVKSAGEIGDKPASKATDKPADKATDKAADRATPKAADTAEAKSAEKAGEKAEGKAPRRSSRKARPVDLPSFSG